MAFEFKKKESVRRAVRRLGRRRMEKALRDLKHGERLEAVHEVRKAIKQSRALLRLVRTAMARTDYRGCSARLRTAAKQLAAARDAHVKVNALHDLKDRFKDGVAPDAFREIRGILAADCRQAQTELTRHRATSGVGRRLRKLGREFTSLRFKDSGWSAIAPGLKRSYRDGRHGYRSARVTKTPEHFHEWRKRVKDLYYQIGLLCPLWPEQMTAAEAELKQLGKSLGEDHDLFLLTERGVFKRFRKQAPEAAEVLKALADQRHDYLRAQALALGARFYEEKPSVFCKRLRQYWKRWRREPKLVAPRGGAPK